MHANYGIEIHVIASFLGASAMVQACHTPAEGPRVQSINDFVVFGAMVVGSFAWGGLLAAYG